MPLFLDTHRFDGSVDVDDVAKAHQADLDEQVSYGVSYLRYWVAEAEGVVYCLVRAPSAAAAIQVHKQAHGLLAEYVLEVKEGP
jgi:hypothetical protein